MFAKSNLTRTTSPKYSNVSILSVNHVWNGGYDNKVESSWVVLHAVKSLNVPTTTSTAFHQIYFTSKWWESLRLTAETGKKIRHSVEAAMKESHLSFTARSVIASSVKNAQWLIKNWKCSVATTSKKLEILCLATHKITFGNWTFVKNTKIKLDFTAISV